MLCCLILPPLASFVVGGFLPGFLDPAGFLSPGGRPPDIVGLCWRNRWASSSLVRKTEQDRQPIGYPYNDSFNSIPINSRLCELRIDCLIEDE